MQFWPLINPYIRVMDTLFLLETQSIKTLGDMAKEADLYADETS